MPKKHFLFIVLIIIQSSLISAQGLYVASGTTFNILPGTAVSIDSLVLTPSASFTLNGNTIIKNKVLVNTLGNTHILRAYNFGGTTAAFTGSVVFGYTDGAELNGLTEDALRLYINNGTMWTPYFTGYVNDETNNTLLVNGIASMQLNEMTLASGTVLPLSWLGIQAVRKNAGIQVQWQTAAEVNVAFYNVERSTDARNWVRVATGILPLQTTAVRRYSFTDYNNYTGRLYYRIKETANTGAQSYSVIVPVMETNANTDVQLYPSPAHDYFKVANVSRDDLKEIQLMDIAGNKVKSWKMLQTAYNVSNLPAGVYHLVFIYSNKTIKTSFNKL